MKNIKRIALLYFTAVCFYIAAVINFFSAGNFSGVIWLSLGSAFLCFAATEQLKNQKSGDKENETKNSNQESE